MLFTEYNEELVRKYDRIEAHKEGYDEGHAEGFDEGHAELNELYSYLHRNKRDADIFKAFTDKDFRDYLLEEYRKLNSKTE